jgi:hypothetical protein
MNILDHKKPTSYVCDMFGCADVTARHWAAKHGVERINRMYLWSDDEIEQFKNRAKRGKPKKV